MTTITTTLIDLIETERTRMNTEYWQEREDLLDWVRDYFNLEEDTLVSAEQIEEYIENCDYDQDTFSATSYEVGMLNGIALALRTLS